jgi:hypothetical protein
MLESIGDLIRKHFGELLGTNMAEDRIQQNDEVEIGLGVPEPDDFETLNQNEADDYREDDETIELPDDEL